MTLEQIKQAFPVKAVITQEIIDTANVDNIYDCIGAKTLKSIFPSNEVHWGSFHGSVHADERRYFISVTTTEDVNMMLVDSPMEVTFIVV